VKVEVFGALGRMGRSVVDVVRAAEDLQLGALFDRSAGEVRGVSTRQDFGAAALEGDVLVDFSLPAATAEVFAAAREAKVPVVCGTTGIDDPGVAAIAAAAEVVPVVVAPNFSQGVTVLFALAAEAARLLGPAFDAEIVEMHHRRKVDAPSGTAARLAEVVREAKGFEREALRYGREGQVGARPDAEIGVMTLRGGDVVGEHTLLLAGAGERLELTHRARDRGIFAEGAVRAARWVVGQPPGRYDMHDVMGL